MERQRVRYTGRVQGVGFRATTRHIASGFEVTGWVRNEPDGSVVLEVQATPDEVARFLEMVRHRLRSNITTESAEPASPQPDEDGFHIAR